MGKDFRFEPGQNVWRVETASRFAFIVDAADYFVALRRSMFAAEKSILLIGWDFDARIRFGIADDGGPEKLGDYLLWLADQRPALEIRLLRWDTGAYKALLRGTMLWTVLRWKAHKRITLRLDAQHPLGGAHHHKVVSIDDRLAYCGGIDVTAGRWDARDHLDDNPARRDPGGKAYGPWHDAASTFDGAAALAIGDLARRRWYLATGERLAAPQAQTDPWPRGVEPTFHQAQLGIARTRPEMPDLPSVHEIETAYVDMIASAKKLIYAESQYFASRRIARALAERLSEADPPEVIIINPQEAAGWVEQLAMDSARAILIKALRDLDHLGRMRIYYPVTAQGQPIYVHAKLMVIDDRLLRVGSSNFNNRSMRLDTECDVILLAMGAQTAQEQAPRALSQVGALELTDPAEQSLAAVVVPPETREDQHDQRPAIAHLRNDLLAEHLGVEAAEVERLYHQTGSMAETITRLTGTGRRLEPYLLPEHSSIVAWLAENEILDPNGPDEIFANLQTRGLFKGWRHLRNRWHRKNRR